MTTKEALILGAADAIVAVVIDLIVTQWIACDRAGGDFVRGVVWYKCIR